MPRPSSASARASVKRAVGVVIIRLVVERGVKGSSAHRISGIRSASSTRSAVGKPSSGRSSTRRRMVSLELMICNHTLEV